MEDSFCAEVCFYAVLCVILFGGKIFERCYLWSILVAPMLPDESSNNMLSLNHRIILCLVFSQNTRESSVLCAHAVCVHAGQVRKWSSDISIGVGYEAFLRPRQNFKMSRSPTIWSFLRAFVKMHQNRSMVVLWGCISCQQLHISIINDFYEEQSQHFALTLLGSNLCGSVFLEINVSQIPKFTELSYVPNCRTPFVIQHLSVLGLV